MCGHAAACHTCAGARWLIMVQNETLRHFLETSEVFIQSFLLLKECSSSHLHRWAPVPPPHRGVGSKAARRDDAWLRVFPFILLVSRVEFYILFVLETLYHMPEGKRLTGRSWNRSLAASSSFLLHSECLTTANLPIISIGLYFVIFHLLFRLCGIFGSSCAPLSSSPSSAFANHCHAAWMRPVAASLPPFFFKDGHFKVFFFLFFFCILFVTSSPTILHQRAPQTNRCGLFGVLLMLIQHCYMLPLPFFHLLPLELQESVMLFRCCNRVVSSCLIFHFRVPTRAALPRVDPN